MGAPDTAERRLSIQNYLIYLYTCFVLLIIPYFTDQSLGKSLQTFEEFLL